MPNDTPELENDPFARGIIRRKVQQLIGHAGFTKQDAESLEQQMLTRLLQSLPSFNPQICHRNSFVTTVVERYVANILRHQKAEKRNHQRVCSLSVQVEIGDEGPAELAATIGDRELDARISRQRRSEEDLSDLVHDMAAVIASLPPQWQQFLELRKSNTIAEIASQMGVPRTTLNSWTNRIRDKFEEAGLRDYLADF